jgi:type II secretory pathway pseudopilin PulG
MRTSPNKYAACATRGFTVLEVSLALAILLGAAILLTQFLVASTRQQKLADQRRLALEELSNRLERMKAAKGSEVTAAKLEAGELSAASKARLPGAKLKADIVDEPGPAGGKQVRLTITWEESGGRTSLELTGWRYSPAEGQP